MEVPLCLVAVVSVVVVGRLSMLYSTIMLRSAGFTSICKNNLTSLNNLSGGPARCTQVPCHRLSEYFLAGVSSLGVSGRD